MQDEEYNKVIIDSANKLAEIRDALFDQIFRVTMAGELKEWSESVEEGEPMRFPKNYSKDVMRSIFNYLPD